MNLDLIRVWVRMRSDYSIYSDKFKRDVNRAHREFFLKRGMDPDNLPRHLRSWSLGDYISLSSPKKNDLPKGQYPSTPYQPSHNGKQMNA